MEIVNLSDLDPNWKWLARSFMARTGLNWKHVSAQSQQVPSWLPRRHTFQRASAALATRGLLPAGNSMLVSHGPRMSMYGAFANRAKSGKSPHLAYSFNFTNLPVGWEKSAMQSAFNDVDRFAVFSTMERALYSEYFRIGIDRIDMIHWAVEPPAIQPENKPLIEGDYICAVGSQARDYRILMDAMRHLPGIRLIVVATPESVAEIRMPPNVEIRFNIPLGEVHDIIAHSRFMVLPLAGSQVPCGHVTIVSAMHLGKAVVATRSNGITDYIQDEITGRLVIPKDADDLADKIGTLYQDTIETMRLGAEGQRFAKAFCAEQNAVKYFQAVLRDFSSAASRD